MLGRVAALGVGAGTGTGGLPAAVLDAVAELYGDTVTVWLDGTAAGVRCGASGHSAALTAALRSWPGRPTTAVVADRRSPGLSWLAGHGVGQCAVVPVGVPGRELGMLMVTRPPDTEPFTVEVLAVLAGLARVCAGVLVRSRMLEDALAALEDAQVRLAQPAPIADALIVCDPGLRILSWNPGAEQVYGYPAGEALDCDLYALLATTAAGPHGRPVPGDVRARLLAALAGTGRWNGELCQRRGDGTAVTVASAVSTLRDGSGVVVGLVVVDRDISEQRRERHNARHDPLTGLPNRRVLTERLGQALARARRGHGVLAVLFLDLDGFKPVNDTFGHAAGDVVLAAVGRRLSATVRDSDLVARLGGDEFVVVLENAGDHDTVAQVVARLRDAVAEPVPLGAPGAVVTVTASVGVATAGRGPDATGRVVTDPRTLLDAADQAMYAAKHDPGRAGVGYAPPMRLTRTGPKPPGT